MNFEGLRRSRFNRVTVCPAFLSLGNRFLRSLPLREEGTSILPRISATVFYPVHLATVPPFLQFSTFTSIFHDRRRIYGPSSATESRSSPLVINASAIVRNVYTTCACTLNFELAEIRRGLAADGLHMQTTEFVASIRAIPAHCAGDVYRNARFYTWFIGRFSSRHL